MKNIIIFSPHPDDAAIGLGGFIFKHKNNYSILIVNVTDGAISANGTSSIRQKEEQYIQAKFGIDFLNLFFEDGTIAFQKKAIEYEIVQIIRKYRPSIIFAPYYLDTHPDHSSLYECVKNSVYYAATNKWLENAELHNCKNIYFYSQTYKPCETTLLVDVSEVYDQKRVLLSYYNSQFGTSRKKTMLNSKLLEKIESRDRYCGSIIDCEFAEPIITESPLRLSNIYDIIRI